MSSPPPWRWLERAALLRLLRSTAVVSPFSASESVSYWFLSTKTRLALD